MYAYVVDLRALTVVSASPHDNWYLQEWGNPNEKEYYEYMKSYSPLDNVKPQVHSLETEPAWHGQLVVLIKVLWDRVCFT